MIIRKGGGQQETPLPILPGYCMTEIQILSPDTNIPIAGVWTNCKDGTVWYNYQTDSRGKVLLGTNSGWANFNIGNIMANGTQIIDVNATVSNIQAPIGTAQRKIIFMNKQLIPRNVEITNGNYIFYWVNDVSVHLSGGGGGGGGGHAYGSPGYRYSCGGGGGGAGYTYSNNITPNHGQVYQAYKGSPGPRGRSTNSGSDPYGGGTTGGAGGSSSFMGISSPGGGGGGGGKANIHGYGGSGVRGGGSGGSYGGPDATNGNGNGGGGGGGYGNGGRGGYPGGGMGSYSFNDAASGGIMAGGGGGWGWHDNGSASSASGGGGYIGIYITK